MNHRAVSPALVVLAALSSSVLVTAGSGGLPDARAVAAAVAWLASLWPPATGTDFLLKVGQAALETLLMATLGTLGAHVLGVPLALFGNARLSVSAVGRSMALPARVWRLGVRGVALSLRGIPELVWALLLVRLVGLGPLAGTLAIALGGAGLVAKVHAEVFESVPRASIDAALANGMRRWQALLHALLPRCRDELLSYSWYRWECALRTSAVLGVVGAGGLGQELDLSLRFFAGDEVATLLICLVLMVLMADALVAATRSGRASGLASGARAFQRAGRLRRLAGCGLLLLGTVYAFLQIGRHAGALVPDPLGALEALLRDFLPPRVASDRWGALAHAALETLAMSFLGTLLAVVFALPLAVLARTGLRAPVVAVNAVLRAVPELFWALLLIIGFGLGPLTGCLAIAVHNTGVLARLFLASLDAFDDPLGDALRCNGASRSAAWLFGTLPGLAPRLTSHALYRWEHAIRAAAVLGVVGAGGLGQSLHISLSLFRLPDAAGTIVAMLVLVLGVDLASFALRRRWVD